MKNGIFEVVFIVDLCEGDMILVIIGVCVFVDGWLLFGFVYMD